MIDLQSDLAAFWRERHLCTFTTIRPDGTPHVVPVGATLDIPAGIVRVITSGDSVKAHRIRAASGLPAALCQLDGRRWSTIEGIVVLRDDAESVREAESRYAERYRTPRVNPKRVVLEMTIKRLLGNVSARVDEQ
ncbi:PPOX class F420-dependent oxidoreductase [Kibdelosporangium philippinense]|uniref:PPOX class F420-dependent oxidoreductase n=1 Tax=Kibdelosporangium philippinense TaxID=211113 RepID=A0ABS8ZME7_9PSEU|nr:PPOX class F420-dependent oxidoreductase [Kibdelosporangium philippinense]MCE7008885.1 PPOX class F420-dependent oxidoreductase [Kibdelosporangium philippinense]